MIEAWLAAKGLFGLKNGVWLVIAALIAAAAFTLITIANNAVEDTLDTAKSAGAAEAVTAGHRTTLQQNKDANDAGHEVRDNRGMLSIVAACGQPLPPPAQTASSSETSLCQIDQAIPAAVAPAAGGTDIGNVWDTKETVGRILEHNARYWAACPAEEE